jgi:hypothetical protein
VVLLVADDTDREPQEFVDRAHPVGIALREILVHRDDVDALAGERVEIRGQRGHQRLALAGAHLGDAAVVECQAADELDVEVPHLERAAGRFTDDREGLGREVGGLGAVRDALAEFVRLGAQGIIAQRLEGGLERSRLAHRGLVAFDDAVIAAAEEPRQKIEHERSLRENFKADKYLDRVLRGRAGILRIDPSARNWFPPRQPRRNGAGPSRAQAVTKKPRFPGAFPIEWRGWRISCGR